MLQRPTPRLILASASASRRAVLSAAALVFDVQPAAIDEAEVRNRARSAGESADMAALRLANLKAAAIAAGDPQALVIGADQILECNGSWFDKPANVAAARNQLRALRGRSHVLQTAVVCHVGKDQVWQHVAAPCLTMRRFSDEFLEAYLAEEGAAVTASVGAYRLEGPGIHLFAAVEGDHSAVLGMPLLPLLAYFRSHGVIGC